MNLERFEHLLSLVQDKIYKRNTRFRESIPDENKHTQFESSHFEYKIMRRPFIFSLNKEMSDKILSLISKRFDMSDSRYR